jgi:hypothetical protein
MRFIRGILMIRSLHRRILLLAFSVASLHAAPQSPATTTTAPAESKVLNATEAAKLLPTEVFFRGQSAPIQARNSGGVRFSKDALLLAALVDTSGYSSAVQEKYQAYLIAETPIEIGGHHLEVGAYGCGFIANDSFIVMDIGGHDLFTAHSTHDANLHRPTPLQIVAVQGDTHKYRLYAGRSFVEFSPSSPSPH